MIAVYPGSFDPATMGHVDIIQRASKIADKLIVAVLANPSKHSLFTVEERVVHLKEITKDMPTVEVTHFEGLLIDFAANVGSNVIIRGLRAMTDFEYEFQMALTNRALNSDVETLLIPTSGKYQYLSSSVVKEIAMFHGNYAQLVPDIVKYSLIDKFGVTR
ncbi:pantetheine-phosphate adenylyltransferase [Tyzzerella sp. OttesenSCG-928-J15]|nr:pantetheine-phosphate adenylyltransferase [Tyzzerella sp. OttesenSCG-928-J15]